MTFDPAAAGDHAEVVRRFGRAVRIKLPKEPAPFEYRTAAHRVSEAAVRRLFTTNLMSALLQHPELSVEANAEWLACHRRHLLLPTGERPQLVASALAIRAALLKAAADPTPGPGLAPLPLPTPGQYLSRWLGAGAGALLGFLGGFLSGVYPFSSHPDHLNFIVSKWLIIIGLVGVLFITVVGMVAGGALGYWVGAAVGLIPAVRRWEPNPAETPEQQSQNSCRSKWQTGCGCLGWFMGFFAGAFAFIAVDTVFGNHRIGGWNSVLFFASSMIGMAVGFLAFARIGGRIADRRKIPNSSQVASETGASTRAEPGSVLSRGDS